MKIAIACDHGALALKEAVKAHLTARGMECVDFGTFTKDSCDYPDFARPAAEAVASGACERGIVLCTTGIGVSITANKVHGIRCALLSDPVSARLTREHNDANMMALGAGFVGELLALEIVALNLFFVIVCGMSADGVALASILTQYLSSVLILIALVRTKDAYGVRPKCIRLHRDKLAPLLTLCCSAGLQNAIFAVANLFIQAGVNRFDALMVEGNSAAANADGLIYDVMAAFHTACASFIGQNYGAGNRDRVRRTYWISLSYSFAAGAVLGLSLVFFGRGFLALFTDSAEVAAAGMHRLCIMGFSYAISAFMDCTIAASRGLGRCVVPTIIVVLGSCVFRVIWVYTIFASVGTIASLYLLYPVSWTLTAGAEMVYFFYLYRKVFRNPAKPATV